MHSCGAVGVARGEERETLEFAGVMLAMGVYADLRAAGEVDV